MACKLQVLQEQQRITWITGIALHKDFVCPCSILAIQGCILSILTERQYHAGLKDASLQETRITQSALHKRLDLCVFTYWHSRLCPEWVSYVGMSCKILIALVQSLTFKTVCWVSENVMHAHKLQPKNQQRFTWSAPHKRLSLSTAQKTFFASDHSIVSKAAPWVNENVLQAPEQQFCKK